MAFSRSATAMTSAGGTNRNTGSSSMNRVISHGHAMRSTLAFSRVTHFIAFSFLLATFSGRQRGLSLTHGGGRGEDRECAGARAREAPWDEDAYAVLDLPSLHGCAGGARRGRAGACASLARGDASASAAPAARATRHTPSTRQKGLAGRSGAPREGRRCRAPQKRAPGQSRRPSGPPQGSVARG